MEFQDQMLETPSGETAFRDYGGSGDHPVLLLHGIVHNLASWDVVAPLLAQFTRVVSVDLIGHGRSTDDGVASLRREVAAVTAVRDLCGLAEPVLVGHSYGAAVAALCAANVDGYAGVVMIEPDSIQTWEETLQATPSEQLDEIRGWSGTADEAASQVDALRRRAADDFGDSAADVMAAIKQRSLVQTEPNRFDRRPSAEYLRSMMATDTDLTEDERKRWSLIVDLYARIDCPLLLLFGSNTAWHDEARAIETRAASLSNVSVRWLPARHFPHLEHPSEVVSLVRNFLEELN
ncbi:MAG TPA: alpha/beta hydrolase [Acidimicrobiales bacterium]|nr:alpha/beta hydrolase [Acidimicrobiales bacterium]